MTSTAIVGYLALFVLVGFLFLFANLVLGWFLRPRAPNKEKLEVYECGEPTIGSSFVQFDLRFYVVALLFLIFDVEVAFFFPWATVFGKATHLNDERMAVVAQHENGTVALTPAASTVLQDLGVDRPTLPLPDKGVRENTAEIRGAARRLALTSMADIGMFFAVLMVGFFYVWKRGDLDWVRALGRDRAQQAGAAAPRSLDEELALTA